MIMKKFKKLFIAIILSALFIAITIFLVKTYWPGESIQNDSSLATNNKEFSLHNPLTDQEKIDPGNFSRSDRMFYEENEITADKFEINTKSSPAAELNAINLTKYTAGSLNKAAQNGFAVVFTIGLNFSDPKNLKNGNIYFKKNDDNYFKFTIPEKFLCNWDEIIEIRLNELETVGRLNLNEVARIKVEIGGNDNTECIIKNTDNFKIHTIYNYENYANNLSAFAQSLPKFSREIIDAKYNEFHASRENALTQARIKYQKNLSLEQKISKLQELFGIIDDPTQLTDIKIAPFYKTNDYLIYQYQYKIKSSGFTIMGLISFPSAKDAQGKAVVLMPGGDSFPESYFGLLAHTNKFINKIPDYFGPASLGMELAKNYIIVSPTNLVFPTENLDQIQNSYDLSLKSNFYYEVQSAFYIPYFLAALNNKLEGSTIDQINLYGWSHGGIVALFAGAANKNFQKTVLNSSFVDLADYEINKNLF
jgi:hypothetical protein